MRDQGCPAPNSTPLLLALGVLSVADSPSASELRTILRKTWLAHPPADVTARFVTRGRGASDSLVEEANNHGDMILLRSSANLSRAVGPLHSLLGWWRCAFKAWPAAQLVGKADDDVYIDLHGLASQLRATQAALVASLPPTLPPSPAPSMRMYYGVMETFSWLDDHQMLTSFGFKYSGAPVCTKGEVRDVLPLRPVAPAGMPFEGYVQARHTGPFHFAKGPLFVLSSSLVSELLSSSQLHAAVAHITALHDPHTGKRHNGSFAANMTKEMPPWEDAIVGMHLATQIAPPTGRYTRSDHQIYADAGTPADGSDGSATGATTLAAVHMGLAAFAEPYGAYQYEYGQPRRSTILWHELQKRVDRLLLLDAWTRGRRYTGRSYGGGAPYGRGLDHARARDDGGVDVMASRRCDQEHVRLRCTPYTSCTGAEWRRCVLEPSIYTSHNCSIGQQHGWVSDACPVLDLPPNSTLKHALRHGLETHGAGVYKFCREPWRAQVNPNGPWLHGIRSVEKELQHIYGQMLAEARRRPQR